MFIYENIFPYFRKCLNFYLGITHMLKNTEIRIMWIDEFLQIEHIGVTNT